MATSPKAALPARQMSRALLPKIEIHSRMNANGTTSTPMMNSRSVRPREMRARNRPTNGAQAIHQAQKNSVQPLSQSSGRS